MREDELLAKIADRSSGLAGRFGQVVIGPGDDCAVVRVGRQEMLLTVDQVVEGRHFRAGTSLDLVARKAVARSVSDIAAMAGTPVCIVATAALRPGMKQEEAEELYLALKQWAGRWGCPLVGGDTASLPRAEDPMVLTVTAMGLPHEKRGSVLRSGAREGDGVYVTGVLGATFDGATGLGKHLMFEPRIREARWLADTLGDRLHAMMDLSDGLGRDAGRMARASGIRIEIDAADIPRAPGAGDWKRAAGEGEDYELVFAAEGEVAARADNGLSVTRIGRVLSGAGCVVMDGADAVDATRLGWEHS